MIQLIRVFLLLGLILSSTTQGREVPNAQLPNASPAETSSVQRVQPNVVLIVSDDQGYADLGCYGARGFETPVIDELAKQGVRFTNFYVSQATCTSSRASIVTGCYANRVGLLGALMPWDKIGLHPKEETLAELLKEQGYATSFIGKWHLGHLPQHLPTEHGFDEYFGLPYSNDMWPVDFAGEPVNELHRKARYPALPLYDGATIVETIDDLDEQSALTRRYTERALEFIEKHAGETPFFVHLAHSMPHVPLGASEAFRGNSDYGAYGDVIEEMDYEVGRLLQSLEAKGVADNTLVIFTSDNGPWLNFGDHAGLATPLKEGKGNMWEGGCRVPCIMRWPGVIEPGRTSADIMTTLDLLPTISEACSARLPGQAIDGVSFLKYLGDIHAQAPRSEFYYYYLRTLCAVRSGRWKMIFPHSYRSYDRTLPGMGGYPGAYARNRVSTCLFDLETDPGEHRDVADLYPEVVDRLKALGEKARIELGDGERVGSGQREAAPGE